MAGSALLSSYLGPLLNSFGIFWFIVFISFIVSLLTIIIYKYTTNQKMMKTYREDLKRMQAELKKNMSNQQKAMQIQKDMMDKNMRLLTHSMTSTLITLIPLGILFLWLNTNLTYVPIAENAQFTVTVSFDDYVGNAVLDVPKGMTIVDNATKEITNIVDWRLSGQKGEYLLEWKVGDKSYTKDVVIGEGQNYAEKTQKYNDGIVKQIDINYKPQKVLNLLGWQLGWLGTYIIFSIIFSMVLRKILKVY